MSVNIEFKARIESVESLAPIAQRLSGGPPEILKQIDTYFTVNVGRLKLRESPQVFDELIFYQRDGAATARGCAYFRQPVKSAQAMRELLNSLCGIDAVVRKTRQLFLIERTRVHLDRVEGLGDFLEFEAVLGKEWDESIGHEKVDELRQAFAIDPEQLIGKSYRELMMEQNPSP